MVLERSNSCDSGEGGQHNGAVFVGLTLHFVTLGDFFVEIIQVDWEKADRGAGVVMIDYMTYSTVRRFKIFFWYLYL